MQSLARLDELAVFTSFNEATSEAIPSLLAFDRSSNTYVIGQRAQGLARTGQPVAQDLKRYIGENDLMFEGRYQASRTARVQRTWPIRPELSDEKSRIPTKQALSAFLTALHTEAGDLPKQLIIGIPTISDEAWQRFYRNHISQVLTELGFERPLFFPEPFAVFQYYRHCKKLISPTYHSQAILILDIGGGTFDSCIIETTSEGNLARGGSTAIPIGVQSYLGAGKVLDMKVLELGISKLNIPVLKQESVEARITSRPWLLLVAEEMKISLANKMAGIRLDEDCKSLIERRTFARGDYHPDVGFDLEVTGEDLKSAIKDIWFKHWGPTMLRTVSQAKFRGGAGVRLQSLDKAILAGGSAGLPFLAQLTAKTLAGQIDVKSSDIIVGQESEKAVAFGLALEAKEQRYRAHRTHNSIGPCVFSSLYLYVAPHRSEEAEKPYIKRLQGDKHVNQPLGMLLAGPIQTPGFELQFEIKLPFKPKGSLVYWFCETDQTTAPSSDRLNVNQDIVRLPNTANRTIRLKLLFNENGMIHPFFEFDGVRREVPAFLFSGLRMAKEVDSFAGIDLGTSNTYVVNMLGTAVVKEPKFPSYAISDSAGEFIRKLEEKIKGLKTENKLTKETVLKLATEIESDFIFHSIKIEGSSLTRGETDDLLAGKKQASAKEMLEPQSLRRAYEFVVESQSTLFQSPESFIREINKLVLGQIDSRGGTFRTTPVKLSGMDYEPPSPTDVPAFMQQLSDEIKAGPGGKSVIQFATEVHNKLAAIHPFVDGNGRTARLLLNAILLDSHLPPVIINFHDKQRYLDCLEASNNGDISSSVVMVAESLSSVLDEMTRPTVEEPPKEEPVSKQKGVLSHAPSQRLGDVIRKKIAAVPANREARYGAWASAFGTFRKEVQACCLGVADAFSQDPMVIRYRDFDNLAIEKFEGLLRGQSVPKTWLMGIEVGVYDKREKFVFSFRSMPDRFRRALTMRGFRKGNQPIEISLAVSRWVDGSPRYLVNEPVSLREIAYVNGEWFAMKDDGNHKPLVDQAQIKPLFDEFLAQVIEAFL